jgi:hypothetical protein
MAILSDTDRKQIWAQFMSDASARQELIGTTLNKNELRAVVDAIDQWIEDNQASFNNSLPEPGKSQLSTKQKVEIFMLVARVRYNVA